MCPSAACEHYRTTAYLYLRALHTVYSTYPIGYSCTYTSSIFSVHRTLCTCLAVSCKLLISTTPSAPSALHYRESFNNIMWLCVMCYSLVIVMMHQTELLLPVDRYRTVWAREPSHRDRVRRQHDHQSILIPVRQLVRVLLLPGLRCRSPRWLPWWWLYACAGDQSGYHLRVKNVYWNSAGSCFSLFL